MSIIEEAEEALSKAKLMVMVHPAVQFFSTVMLSLAHYISSDVPTAATNGKYVKYNPQFFMDLTQEERVFLVLHETMHVVLMHMIRLMGLPKDSQDAFLWNVAGDYVINDILILAGFKMPKGGLHDVKYRGMTTEQVYASLKQEQKDQDDYDDFDMDMEEPEGSEGEVQAELDDILVRAAIQEERSGQSSDAVPLEVRRYVEGLLTPKLPWNRILARFMNDLAKTDYTYRKPNRRYFPEHILPTSYSYGMEHIAVIIDTSGSITKDQFTQFISDTHHILKQYKPKKLTVVQFGSSVCAVDVVENLMDMVNLKLVHGGGTRIKPVIDWMKENKPKGAIVFTDGWFEESYYEELKIPTVWAIHTNKKFKKRFGIHIEYEL